MIVDNSEQGSEEWLQARLGIPTASNFDQILSPTGKASTQAKGYMHKLLAEWLTGESESYSNEWIQRGNELEPEARQSYEFIMESSVAQTGLIYLNEDRMIGGSPDGLIGDLGGYEVKCPAPKTHVEYLLSGKIPTKYIPQVQGLMWITERDWWDFMSYHPKMEPLIIRVARDQEYIKALSSAVGKFVDNLLEAREKLQHLRRD